MADDPKMLPGVPQSVLELSAFNPVARDNPHPLLQSLQAGCPVMRDETARVWVLSRYKDIRDTVNDRTFVRHPLNADPGSITARLVDPERDRRTSILFLDDPDHARIRQPLAKARALTFSSGAAWRRLNSARRSSRCTRSARAASVPAAISCSGVRSSSM